MQPGDEGAEDHDGVEHIPHQDLDGFSEGPENDVPQHPEMPAGKGGEVWIEKWRRVECAVPSLAKHLQVGRCRGAPDVEGRGGARFRGWWAVGLLGGLGRMRGGWDEVRVDDEFMMEDELRLPLLGPCHRALFHLAKSMGTVAHPQRI